MLSLTIKPLAKRPGAGPLACLVVLTLVMPRIAFAADKPKVLVLPVQSGSLGKGDREAATKSAADAVSKYKDLALLPTPQVDLLEVMVDLECTDLDDECLGKMGKKWGADQVVFVDVKGKGSALSLDFRVIDSATGKSIKRLTGTADGKGAVGAALGKALTEAFGALPADKPPDKPPEAQKVAVTLNASVEGAEVTLNGALVGKTPVRAQLKPGKYDAKVTRTGYVTLTQTIEVKNDGSKTADFVFTLVAEAAPIDPPPVATSDTPYYKTWWFWTAIGVGVTALGVGLGVGLTKDTPAATGVMSFGIGAPDHDPLIRSAK